jgi:hypothetical protein
VTRKEAYPGDEGSNYARNPGEAWAEVYRLTDERKAGITTATWPIIAPSFYPDAPALDAAELDVVQPWTAPRTPRSRVFGKKTAKVWWIPLSTPLDGDADQRHRSGTRHRRRRARRFEPPDDRSARAMGEPARQAARGSICGQRSLFVRVTETGLQGRFASR